MSRSLSHQASCLETEFDQFVRKWQTDREVGTQSHGSLVDSRTAEARTSFREACAPAQVSMVEVQCKAREF